MLMREKDVEIRDKKKKDLSITERQMAKKVFLLHLTE